MLPVIIVLATALLGAQTRGPASEAARAQELVAAGKLNEAAGIYRKLLAAAPDNPGLLLNLCITEYKAAQYREAAAHASAALKLEPGLLPARLFLGASQLELGDFTGAAGSLEIVLKANPQERNGRLMLGEALLGLGRAAESAQQLRAAVEMLPGNSRAWYSLGRAYEALQQPEAAAEAWSRLAALPASAELHLHSAQVLDAGGRWREAAMEWRAALAIAPENRAAKLGLAWSLFRLRDYDAAMAVLKPMLTGIDGAVQFLYGASLLNQQQPEAALPYLRAAVAQDPAMMPAPAALGQALLMLGKPEEAVALLRAVSAADTDGTIHFQLFRAYQLLHREDEAREALAAYQRLRSLPPPVH